MKRIQSTIAKEIGTLLFIFLVTTLVILGWDYFGFGITEISPLKIILIIFSVIFVILNMVLFYLEFLELEYKNKEIAPSYMGSGVGSSGIVAQLKRIGTLFTGSVGLYASVLTIKDAFSKRNREDDLNKEVEKVTSELENCKNDHTVTNFKWGLQLDSIQRSNAALGKLENEESTLMKIIKDKQTDFSQTEVNLSPIERINKYAEIKRLETQREALALAKTRAKEELKKDVENGVKFSNYICNEPDEEKAIKKINEGINKASIIDFDLEKLLTKLTKFADLEYLNQLILKLAEFDTLDGISKLMFTLILTNYLIL